MTWRINSAISQTEKWKWLDYWWKKKNNSHIALQLGVSTCAVELHLTHIYEKLGVSSRAEAIVKLIHLFEK